MDTSFASHAMYNTSNENMASFKCIISPNLDNPMASYNQKKFPDIMSSSDNAKLNTDSIYYNNPVIQQHSQVSNMQTQQQTLITEEQELYATDFVDALNEFHQFSSPSQFHPSSPSDISSDGQTTLFNNNYSSDDCPNTMIQDHSNFSDYNFPMKQKYHAVPNSSECSGYAPTLLPVDIFTQENIKLERKRHRNRVAASKCRKRKLERIARLEDKVKMLQNFNSELEVVLAKLKESVCHLNEQLMEHVNSGCQVIANTDYR